MGGKKKGGKRKGGNKSQGEAKDEPPAIRFKNQGNTHFVAKRYEDAIVSFTKGIAADPSNLACYSNRSHTYLTRAEPAAYVLALADADKCVELDPSWAKGHMRRAAALKAMFRITDGIAAINQALALDAANEQYQSLAKELAEMKALDIPDAGEEEAGGDKDKFQLLEEWLQTPTADDKKVAEFPLLYMKRYSENHRGVHVRVNIPVDTIILRIPRRYLITVEMGKDTDIGRKMVSYDVDVTAKKHCYLCIYAMTDRLNMDSYYQPYYKILPTRYDNMPIFWDKEQLSWLEGSYLLTQISDRIKNIRADREEIMRAAPAFSQFDLEEFMWARMMVASRNFGVTIDKVKTDALVPYADMLNHLRPRETSWTFNQDQYCFTITSLKNLKAGQQVYDSYGKKCNSRFLLNYGFAVEHNAEVRGQNHNECRLSFRLKGPEDDPNHNQKIGLLDGSSPRRDIRVGTWYNHPSTLEAFSFCRFMHAEGNEILVLPQIGYSYELGKNPIKPISCSNEAKVLKTMASMFLDQLAKYPRSIEEDQKDLDDGIYEMYSNHRNVIVVLRGEKEVCHYYINLAHACLPLLRMQWKDAKKVINKKYKEPVALVRYLDNVIIPLIKKRAGVAGQAADAAESAAAAAKELETPSPFATGTAPEVTRMIESARVRHQMNRKAAMAASAERRAKAAAARAAKEAEADEAAGIVVTAGGAGGGAGAGGDEK